MKIKLLAHSLLSLFFLLAGTIHVKAFNTDLSGDIGDSGLSDSTIYDILLAVMNWLLMIVTVVAVIGFIISGIIFITAGGAGRAADAKNWLTYSIVGIVVALSGYIILLLVDMLLQGNTI